jgi:hypothetical protein
MTIPARSMGKRERKSTKTISLSGALSLGSFGVFRCVRNTVPGGYDGDAYDLFVLAFLQSVVFC